MEDAAVARGFCPLPHPTDGGNTGRRRPPAERRAAPSELGGPKEKGGGGGFQPPLFSSPLWLALKESFSKAAQPKMREDKHMVKWMREYSDER